MPLRQSCGECGIPGISWKLGRLCEAALRIRANALRFQRMLNYVHIENFRAFGRPTTIPLAPITLLFGENSSGKTSILHALSLLKQTAESSDSDTALVTRSASGALDLGSFADFLHDHDHDRVMRLGVGLTGPLGEKAAKEARAAPYSTGITWAFRQPKRTDDVICSEIAVTSGLEPQPIAILKAVERPQESELDRAILAAERGLNWFQLEPGSLAPEMLESLRLLLGTHRHRIPAILDRLGDALMLEHWSGESAARVSGVQSQVREDIKRLAQSGGSDAAYTKLVIDIWGRRVQLFGALGMTALGGPSSLDFVSRVKRLRLASQHAAAAAELCAHPLLALEHQFHLGRMLSSVFLRSCVVSIGPFRAPAARLYTYSGTRPRQVGRSGERVADLLHRDSDAVDRTNEWLSRFEIGYRLRLRPVGTRHSDVFEVRLVDRRRSPSVEVAFSDVGFGISQMLPIIVQCVAARNRFISIEQPEVHIHPRLQAEVGDLLVDCVKTNGHQFLVETHSEHLVLRLRRLVRERKVKPEDISVIHVGRERDGSRVKRVGIRADGTFDTDWPGGFFPERMRELL